MPSILNLNLLVLIKPFINEIDCHKSSSGDIPAKILSL